MVLAQEGPKPVIVGKVILSAQRFVNTSWACFPWFHAQDVLMNDAETQVMVVFWILASDAPALFEFTMNSMDLAAQKLVEGMFGSDQPVNKENLN